MARKRLFKTRKERTKHVNHLMRLSSMPKRETDKWEKLVPNMTSEELGQFQDILEREITELADIYLRVLQRRAESRVADIGSEFGEETLGMKKGSLEQYFEVAPTADETQFEVVEDPNELSRERNILRYLLAHANFITSDKKERMLETVMKLPLVVVKDLQNVVIREGLRALRRKKFHDIDYASFHSPQSITEALLRQ